MTTRENFTLTPAEEKVKADFLNNQNDAAKDWVCHNSLQPTIEEQIKFFQNIAHQSVIDNQVPGKTQIIVDVDAHPRENTRYQATHDPKNFGRAYVAIGVSLRDKSGFMSHLWADKRLFTEKIRLDTLESDACPKK
jgi:hypothetical protein